jgi:NADPH-dependent ferric siderophore reductase
VSAEPDVDDPIAAIAASYIEHLNDEHGDWSLVVGRAFGDLPDAERAVVVGLDRDGIDLAVGVFGATHAVRVPFPRPIDDGLQLQLVGVELARTARQQLGQDELTLIEREVAELVAIRTFVTGVVRTETVTRGVRQITFGGGDLATFRPIGPDQFLYVLAPPPGRTELGIDASFTWEQFAAMPSEDQPIGAYYTVRRWRPDVGELDLLFVLHGIDADGHDDGTAGPAARWAATAAPGDPVALWGPRTAYAPPAATDRYVLVADDTGLPGVAAIIESLPAGTPIDVVAEVDSEEDRLPLPEQEGLTVTWCYRRGAAAGTTTALVDAVRALPWPEGTTYAWGGAESKAITAVRRHLRDERGLSQDAVSMTGYWRLGDH